MSSGKRYCRFPGESKFAYTPYPKMEVGKCYAVVKGTVYGLDRDVVFSGSLQHWIRTKRLRGPVVYGLSLFLSKAVLFKHVDHDQCLKKQCFPYYVLLWCFLIYLILFLFKSSGQNPLSWLFEPLINRCKPTLWETLY